MNSPFATLFLAITDRIKTAVPSIRYIDQDLGQLEYYQTTPSVSFPCVLIDLDSFTCNSYSENAQELTGNVIIRLAFTPYSASNSATPQLYRQKALEYYDIEYALYKALQGFSAGDEFGALNRTTAETEKRDDPFRVRALTFSLALDDYSAKYPALTAPADPVIKPQLTP